MIFGKTRLELKVGIFVFVSLIILAVFVLMIGDIKRMVSNYRVDFVFSFINGVRTGAPVRYAGVDIGEVKEIKFERLDGRDKVCLVALIKKEIKIPVDSQIWVNTLGLLGEKYIEVMPGSDYEHFVQPGDQLTGNDPLAMQEVGELAKSIAQKVDDTIQEVRKVAVSMNALTANLDDGITRIKNKEGTLGKLIYDDEIYNELNALVGDVKRNPWKLFWKSKEKAQPPARDTKKKS
jgi:phospholipid/cholesterol/gamma-HCH transport system substrate-binding protein